MLHIYIYIYDISRLRVKGRIRERKKLCLKCVKNAVIIFGKAGGRRKRVNSFMYLGTLIKTDNNSPAEINNRITLANRSYFGLVNKLKDKRK